MPSIAYQFINFFIFLVILYVFFRKPILKSMAERRELFLLAQKDAAQALDIAQKNFDETQNRKAQLEGELKKLQSLATESGEREHGQILNEARLLSETIKSETLRIKESELTAAKASLEKEISAIVKQKVETLLTEKLRDKNIQETVIKNKIAALETINLN